MSPSASSQSNGASSQSSGTISFTSFSNIVNGKPRGSKSQYHGVSPATKEELWPVPIATEQDVEDAVEAAAAAFPAWKNTPFDKRCELVGKLSDLFMHYEQEFTELLMAETGKPKRFANGEVKSGEDWFQHHVALKLPEERIEDDDKVITTKYVPLGIVGAIVAWNFPLALAVGKIAPALVTGNCIIVKPSPFTPYTALKLVEIVQSILPPGVVQALGGDEKLGPWIVSHPGIQKISFTGSIATGKKIMAEAAKTLKRVTLELGGNDASIICADVDIEKVAPQVAFGAFANSGQVCVATKRIYIHESIYEPFVKAMVKFTASLKVGTSEEEGVMLGPIQNQMQYEKVTQFFEDSKKNGYKFAAGPDVVESSKGFFIQPTIIDNPPNDSRIITEEPFGPIVPCQPWTSEPEVIARANATNTGLGACVWSKDVARAVRIAAQLEAGSVFVNSSEKPVPQAVFGGHKESGIGGEWGSTGLLAFCNAQVLHVYKDK
ncbi:aldehyde dehydrogenase [Lasallia pustulata]|uniref:aldehyde dehydrogenase (NAD(+)) n=1 Tax=Lasallia pustulata TaxID=136370 RepID=A0A1W5D1R2_9LECA|nr:aldehyde dehydrogenase [Lasallia pustulata]